MLCDHCDVNHLQVNSMKLCSCYSLKTLFNVFCPLKKDQVGELIVNNLKGVSFFLPLVSAVHECNIQQHLLTGKNMIYLAFADDHQN